MIIILNGSIGVGKTTLSWKLNEKLQKSVMLDGDYFGAVYPFDLQSEKRIEYLYDTMVNTILFHQKNDYDHFILNYVFETPESLALLIDKLEVLNQDIHCYLLILPSEVQEKRIIQRNTDQVLWELKRAVELNAILEKAKRSGNIGLPIYANKSVDQLAEMIIAEHE